MVSSIVLSLDKTTVVSGGKIHVTGTWDFDGLPPSPRVACYQSIPVWKVVYADHGPSNTGTFEFDWTAPVVGVDTAGFLYSILQNYVDDLILASHTVDILVVPVPVVNGFTIRTSLGLSTKTVLVAHVVKMPFIGLVGPDPDLWYWPQAFDYVGGKWYMTDPATKYRVEVGSIFETIPSFDKTYGTGSFADGIHCVVLAEGEGGVGSLIFKGEDVFQLFKDSPTEIYLSSTSTDVLTEAVMGPVCDFFGIPRGSECDSFWAEFYDPVYVANYVSIMQTGKDTLGNDRELSGFDHIALPFAVLGSLPGLSLLPFGALVTKGLGAISKAGAKFGENAIQFMLQFSMDATNKVSSKDKWTFLDAVGQMTEEHATEVVEALIKGDTNTANDILLEWAGESKGWWDYHTINDLLRDALPEYAYTWLRQQIGLDKIGAGTVTNTAKQATLSADDIAKLADAAKDSGVMDEAVSAVYKSLVDMSGASATKVEELANILKNSPEISAKIGAKNTPMKHLVDLTEKHHDLIKNQLGQTKANTWFKNNAEIARKALDSADPAKMADIPKAAQDLAAKQGDIIDDAVAANPKVSKVRAEDILFGIGRKSADEIVDTAQEFADDVPTNWYTKARQRVFVIPNRIIKKWASLKRYEKVLCIWFMVDNVAFIVYMIAKFLGLGPGDRGFSAWNLAKSVTDAKWLCKESCEDKRFGDLESDIAIFEVAINNLEGFLDEYEFSLKLSNSYDAPKSVLDIGKSSLKIYQECLVNRGVEIAPSTGKIVFFAIDHEYQAVVAGAYVDRWRVGTIWGSGLEISEVDPGTYDLEVKASGYTGCTDRVDVIALKTETFECTLQEIEVCSPITDVKIYIDPLSPVKDQTISFNGSANSDDPITKWEWDFGDGFTATGQAATHTYDSAGIYSVILKVTNDCENSEFTTRNVTVTEEAVEESGTLLVQKPINAVTKTECTRAWEAIIHVDGQTIGKTTPFSIPFGTDTYIGGHGGPCGTHDITIILSGYDTVSKTITIDDGDTKSWQPEMYTTGTTPTERTISFSVPVGSTLYVDGELVTGTTVVGRLTTIFNDLRKR